MPKTDKISVQTCGGMEQFLEATNSAGWKKYHNNKTCAGAYSEIKNVLRPIQDSVVTGAMNDSVQSALQEYKKQLETINSEADEEIRRQRVQELFASDPVVFLNDHGPEHMEKVIERANAILMNFERDNLSEFETFLLLSAIQIHDIGNILGRAGHERKLIDIFDQNCKTIVVDAPERRIIKNIAMAHSGKTSRGKDTISLLSRIEPIHNTLVRTRLLAAILRFSDELADDSSRANRAALDLDILGTNSRIYHCYSKALHTVTVERDIENNDCKVSLIYELEAHELKELFSVGGTPKYLLDEIYDRTMKMELERRYCVKFMQPYLSIGRIVVVINIYGDNCEKVESISYTLEDIAYPDLPITNQIGDGGKILAPSGEALLQSLIEKGAIKDD